MIISNIYWDCECGADLSFDGDDGDDDNEDGGHVTCENCGKVWQVSIEVSE